MRRTSACAYSVYTLVVTKRGTAYKATCRVSPPPRPTGRTAARPKSRATIATATIAPKRYPSARPNAAPAAPAPRPTSAILATVSAKLSRKIRRRFTAIRFSAINAVT